jgi:hypothetical protein
MNEDLYPPTAMIPPELWVVPGFRVKCWHGDRGGYYVVSWRNLPSVTEESAWFVQLNMAGSVVQTSPDDPNYRMECTMQNPNGPSRAREGGLLLFNRFAEDGTVRWCVSSGDDITGEPNFDALGYQTVRGESAAVHVPQGGIFVLIEGEVTINGEDYVGPNIIQAVSGPLDFSTDVSVYGIASWKS